MSTLIVEICTGPLCHQCGANDLFNLVDALPIEKRELIDLRAVEFFTGSRQGPSVRINGTVMSAVTPKRLLRVIDETIACCDTETA